MTSAYKKQFGGSLPWETFQFPQSSSKSWLPSDDSARCGAYEGYSSIYWTEDYAYTLRVLVTEQPLYVPLPRVLVNTMAHYTLKGLKIGLMDPEKYSKESDDLAEFLRRQMFLAKFHIAKHDGCIRGDYVLHLTADDERPPGEKLCVDSVYPGKVVRKFDDDDGEAVTDVWIVEPYVDPDANSEQGQPAKKLIRRLHYWYGDGDNDADDLPSSYDDDNPEHSVPAPDYNEILEGVTGVRQVWRELEVLEVDDKLWTDEEKVYSTLLDPEVLPAPIDCIPVYWFKNIPTDGQPFGSSDIRGFERQIRGMSQELTDLGVGLALDGLGTYVTDGGRPVDDTGKDTTWTIEPGQILELQNGTYFKRVEGLQTITPAIDYLKYHEAKIQDAAGLSDVSMGNIDSSTASNPMALAIKFLPTLAAVEEREALALGRLFNLFSDWTLWRQAYEDKVWPDKAKFRIEVGEKLPQDRTARVNELNNMLDRSIISKQYYRAEMQKLGYEFPDDLQTQIDQEREDDLKFNAVHGVLPNVPAETAAAGGAQGDPENMPQGVNGQKSTTLPPKGNQSNNKGKTNESKGNESGHSLARQARGVTPPVKTS